jgi:hypothetical protein
MTFILALLPLENSLCTLLRKLNIKLNVGRTEECTVLHSAGRVWAKAVQNVCPFLPLLTWDGEQLQCLFLVNAFGPNYSEGN